MGFCRFAVCTILLLGVRVEALPGLPLPCSSQCLLLGWLLCVTPPWATSFTAFASSFLPGHVIAWDDRAPHLPSYFLTNSSFPTKASCSTPVLLIFLNTVPTLIGFIVSLEMFFSSFSKLLCLGTVTDTLPPLGTRSWHPFLAELISHQFFCNTLLVCRTCVLLLSVFVSLSLLHQCATLMPVNTKVKGVSIQGQATFTLIEPNMVVHVYNSKVDF